MKNTENQLPRLIAIHGKKRTGKGVVSKHLNEKYGYEIIKFAAPLKDMVTFFMKKAGFSDDVIFLAIESDYKEVPIDAFYNKSSRYIMQTLGLEWRNSVNKDMFALMSESFIKDKLKNNINVAIDDLRFSHEYDFLNNFKAEFWCILRDVEKISVPKDVPSILIAPNKEVFTENNFKELMELLLVKYCGYNQDVAKVLVNLKENKKINDIFGNTSPYKATENLSTVWLPLMKTKIILTEELIQSHIGEQGLPLVNFDIVIENQSGIYSFIEKIDNNISKKSIYNFK
jgi:hypothetical protein